MNRSKLLFAGMLVLALAIARPAFAQQGGDQGAQQACKTFAQQFYDWYVPKVSAAKGQRAWDLAVKEKTQDFAPDLVTQLKEDSTAQDKVTDDIVGLDFDPFLNTDDPAKKYVLGNVIARGDSCLVEVFAVSAGKKSAKPDVVAEIERANGALRFANFHYGKSDNSPDENLLRTLKLLRDSRNAPGK